MGAPRTVRRAHSGHASAACGRCSRRDGTFEFPGGAVVRGARSLSLGLLVVSARRHKGIKILQALCRISLEPDSCVRRTQGIFSKQGARSLLVAKFLPGLGLVTPPLAGVFRMRFRRFLLFDAIGSMLWAGVFLAIGYAFAGQIERVAAQLASLGGWLLVLLAGALAAYIAYKFVARQRFLRELRIARITVDELKEKLDAGENVTIVDLRHSMDFEASPETIPGALHMDAKELEATNDRLPRDGEVVLYCTCPN